MSEFKFACPVCGQHITASSDASGSQIECPTCFQKIVVPQARAQDSKFILQAAQVDKPRPPQTALQNTAAAPRRSSTLALPVLILLLVAAVGAGVYVFRGQLGLVNRPDTAATNQSSSAKSATPVNDLWTMDDKAAKIPDAAVTGKIHGQPFTLSRVILQGGTLSLRQGKAWPPDLGLNVLLHARRGEDLAGKVVKVAPDQAPPVPKVVLRWKNDQGQPVTKNFPGGYLLRIEFGDPASGRMPGKIYISFPDDEKSAVAGTFNAEIRAPEPRKKKTPPPVPKT